MKIKIFEKTFFVVVLLLLPLFPLAGAASGGVTLIILDITPPVVMITNPVNNTAINIFNNTISGTVSDNMRLSQVNLSLNGNVLYTWNSTGAFNKKVNYTANTTAVITITASDTSNNNVSETIRVDILPNTVSRTVTTTANVVETVDAKNETNMVINFTTVQDVTGSINVTAGTSASAVGAIPMAGHGLEQDQQSIDKYLEINVSDSINAASGNISWAVIAMYYSDADLDKNGNGNASDPDDINESSLKFWWYCSNCPSESKWRVLETGNDYTSLGGPYVYEASVNMPNNYVWANVSHFSVYNIAGTIISAPPVLPTLPISPAPLGGGGGGGVASPKITIQTTTGKVEIQIDYLPANKDTTVTIPSTENMPLSSLKINPNKRVTNVEMNISTLDAKPSDISADISGVIKDYIQIDTKNIQDADINNVTDGFKVPVSWIDNNIDKATVVLNRYADGKWTALTTAKSSEDSNYVYYSATSSGFSVFGISGQVRRVVTTAPPSTTVAPVPTAPPVTSALPTAPITTAPPVERPPVGKIILAILVILIIAGAAYYWVATKKRE